MRASQINFEREKYENTIYLNIYCSEFRIPLNSLCA